MGWEPIYVRTREKGLLKAKIKEAFALLDACVLCARGCDVNRSEGKKGFCNVTDNPVVSSSGPHFGEEAPLVGYGGSGTIFLTHCNLGCIFCQNYDISHLGKGYVTSPAKIARVMLSLQQRGCHNINFVTPTHQMPFLIKAIEIAAENGLSLPIVWNCGGYESLDALKILDGIVDIYMPDFKFWDERTAFRYTRANGYPEVARNALREMHRQVGDLYINAEGIALRGLMVRHLVLPERLAGTEDLVRWLSEEISPRTYLNVMAQYRPCYKAFEFSELSRCITEAEYSEALGWARDAGLRLDQDITPKRRIFF
jgi:putative pyruvate formate lyase activating enzyme